MSGLNRGKWESIADRGQSIVCVIAIQSCKTSGVITYRDFNTDEARKCTLNIALRTAVPVG